MELEDYEVFHFKNMILENRMNREEIVSYLEDKGMTESEINSSLNRISNELKKSKKTFDSFNKHSFVGPILMSIIGMIIIVFPPISLISLSIFYLLIIVVAFFSNKRKRILSVFGAIIFLTTVLFLGLYIFGKGGVFIVLK